MTSLPRAPSMERRAPSQRAKFALDAGRAHRVQDALGNLHPLLMI
jgi:hypothetical protein